MKQFLKLALAAFMIAPSFASAKVAPRKPVARRAPAKPAARHTPAKPGARRGPAKPAHRRVRVIEAPVISSSTPPSQPVTADPKTKAKVVADVAGQLKRMKGIKTAFCFAVEDGTVTGYNEDTPVRAASVVKTLTTFWALQTHKPDYQYTTHVYYQASNKELHISGTRDPFFDRERLYVLMADLNKKGIKEISRLTFDDSFWFYSDAQNWRYLSGARKRGQKISDKEAFFAGETHTRNTFAGDPERIKEKLNSLLNTAKWDAFQKNNLARARTSNPAGGIPATVTMKTDVVDHVPSNPLAGKPGVIDLVIKSAPLKNYLKFMNIHSVNPYAEELFFSLGGIEKFRADMSKLGYGDQLKGIHSGSGVNLYNVAADVDPSKRVDSVVSCSTVVRIIRRMDEQLEALKLDLSDVMAAPGVAGENATWRDPSRTLVVKTGTMKRPTPLRNLSGVENTTSGEIYFGIFIDGRTNGTYAIRHTLTTMNANHFRGKPVTTRAYSYQPIGAWSHAQAPGAAAAAAPVVATAPPAATPAPVVVPPPPAPAVIAKPIAAAPTKPAPATPPIAKPLS